MRAWWATVHRVMRVRHNWTHMHFLKDLLCLVPTNLHCPRFSCYLPLPPLQSLSLDTHLTDLETSKCPNQILNLFSTTNTLSVHPASWLYTPISTLMTHKYSKWSCPLGFSHVHLDVIKACLILFIKTELLIFLGQFSWTQQMITSPLFSYWGQTSKLDSFLFVYPTSYSWTCHFSNTLKYIQTSEGFPGGSVLKNPPANAGDTGLIPDPGGSHMPRSN